MHMYDNIGAFPENDSALLGLMSYYNDPWVRQARQI